MLWDIGRLFAPQAAGVKAHLALFPSSMCFNRFGEA